MATQWSWHDEANRQYAAEEWQADANRQYEAEMRQKRLRLSGVYNSSNSGSTPAPTLQLARAPADTPVTAPSQASSFVVACSGESGGQLCSTLWCCRPGRYWRIDCEAFSGEQVCCPSCKAPPDGTTNRA